MVTPMDTFFTNLMFDLSIRTNNTTFSFDIGIFLCFKLVCYCCQSFIIIVINICTNQQKFSVGRNNTSFSTIGRFYLPILWMKMCILFLGPALRTLMAFLSTVITRSLKFAFPRGLLSIRTISLLMPRITTDPALYSTHIMIRSKCSFISFVLIIFIFIKMFNAILRTYGRLEVLQYQSSTFQIHCLSYGGHIFLRDLG